jgi:hypothetical protein
MVTRGYFFIDVLKKLIFKIHLVVELLVAELSLFLLSKSESFSLLSTLSLAVRGEVADGLDDEASVMHEFELDEDEQERIIESQRELRCCSVCRFLRVARMLLFLLTCEFEVSVAGFVVAVEIFVVADSLAALVASS